LVSTYGVKTQKNNIVILTAVITSNLDLYGKTTLRRDFSPEDGDNMLLRNVGVCLESTRRHNPE
jgi:hypothetical protein